MVAHRPSRVFFVGVVGAAGVGKDSFARALAATVPHASIIPIALPIRILAVGIGGLCPPNRASLIALGASGRSMRADTWIVWHRTLVALEQNKDADAPCIPRRDADMLANYRCIIVPDVRFLNEAQYIREYAPHSLLVGIKHPSPDRNVEHDVMQLLPQCDFVWENTYTEPFTPTRHFRPLVHDVVMRVCDRIHTPREYHAT